MRARVRGSLVYRAFCRIDGERVPDAKTRVRLAHLRDDAVLQDVLARLVTLGRERGVLRGRRLRVDTTVVETNIHYPTDSTLLADGVRVLTRTLQRLGHRIRNRQRSVARRVFEIAQRSRTTGTRASQAAREQSKARMKALYRACCGSPGRCRAKRTWRRPSCRRGQRRAASGSPSNLRRRAVADAGFTSRANEQAAQRRGVRHVVFPRQSRDRRSRVARLALRWRTGSEGRISALKRCHGLRRCRYRGPPGCSAGSDWA
jgi:hypothetical protein